MPQKHRIGFSKLNRSKAHRRSVLRNLCLSLFTYGRIITRKRLAKEARRVAEKLITKAKQNNLASYRRVLAFLQKENVVKKLFRDISLRFKDRQGGYTRIIKLGGCRWDSSGKRKSTGYGKFSFNQLGDNAERVILELVELKPKEEEMYLAGIGRKIKQEKIKMLEEKRKLKKTDKSS